MELDRNKAMPIYKPPSLNRQNAFILEDDQTETPLDSTCRICSEYGTDNDPLFQPCQCRSSTYPTLYAHSKCFTRWSSENGHPKQCIKCKSIYAKVPSTTLPNNRRKYLIPLIVSIAVIYSCYCLISTCSVVEKIPNTQLYADFGVDYNNVPELLITPVKCA